MIMHDLAKEFADYYNEVNAERIEEDQRNTRKKYKMNPMNIERGADFITDFVNFLVKKINEEDRIYISGLGVFKHVKRNGRYVNHPVTQERVFIPEQDTVIFKMAENVKSK